MSRRDSVELWGRLQEAGLVTGEAPGAVGVESPWYVRVMLGVAGWIGSLFLLGFVGVGFAFVMESAAAALVVGALVCGVAFLLFRSSRERDFLTQLGLAIGLVGQMLLIYGLYELFERHDALLFGAVFVVEALLAVALPNFIARVMSSLAAAIALAFALHSAGLQGLATGVTASGFAVVWSQELRWGRFGALCRPAGYGLALALLLYRAGILWGSGLWWPGTSRGADWLAAHAPWLGNALVAAVFLAVVAMLLRRARVAAASRAGVVVLGGAGVVVIAAFPVPGFVAALLILMIGFAASNRILLGLGLLACAAFLSHYYYLLETTLLSKSLLLTGLGVALLAGRVVVGKALPPATTGGGADA